MVELEISNITGTIEYDQRFALDAVADALSDRNEISEIRFNPTDLHLIHSRIKPSDTYVAFYKNGVCSITGVNSKSRFDEEANKVNSIITDLIQPDQEPSVDIKNIVATTQLNSKLSLRTLAIKIGLEQVEYEPEQFPAMIYHGDNCVLLVFSSGKIISTGTTNLQQASTVINELESQADSI